MTQGLLRISIASVADKGAGAFAARVQRIAPAWGPAHNTSVPVGGVTELPCERGTYRVAVYAPRGETFETEIEVEEGQSVNVVAASVRPAREWLYWQTTAANTDEECDKDIQRRRRRARLQTLARITLGVGLCLVAALAIVSFSLFAAAPQRSIAVQEIPDVAWEYEYRETALERAWPRGVERPELIPGIPEWEPKGIDAPPAALPNAGPALVLFTAVLALAFMTTGGFRRLAGWPDRDASFTLSSLLDDLARAPIAFRKLGSDLALGIRASITRTPLSGLKPGQILLASTSGSDHLWRTLGAAYSRPEALFAGAHGFDDVAILEATRKDAQRRMFELRVDASRSGNLFCISRPQNGRADLVLLPTMWRMRDGNETTVEVMESLNEFGQPELSTTVRDAQFSPVLGYLVRGQLTEARIVIEDQMKPVAHEINNPLSAAAIGYCLMGSARPGDDIRWWRAWLEHMHLKFPASPDIGILEAWACLLTEDRSTGLPRAQALFEAAFDRGLPAYTEGVRRLRNGLTIFAPTPTRGADGVLQQGERGPALTAIDTLSRYCVPQQVFTTLRLGQ